MSSVDNKLSQPPVCLDFPWTMAAVSQASDGQHVNSVRQLHVMCVNKWYPPYVTLTEDKKFTKQTSTTAFSRCEPQGSCVREEEQFFIN